MQKVRIDVAGQKFGRLTALEYAYTKKGTAFWKCKCECGNETTVRGTHLRNGAIKSCGCLKKETTVKTKTIHGKRHTRIYNTWRSMKGRCERETNAKYKSYGARGIKVYDIWHDFMTFYDWAMDNGYNDSLTIERIDVNGNYEPSNCTWITSKEQSYNKTNSVHVEVDGETKTLAEWAEHTGIYKQTIYNRYYRGDRGMRLIRPVEQKRAN